MRIFVDPSLEDYYFDNLKSYIEEVEEQKTDVMYNLHIFEAGKVKVYKHIESERFNFEDNTYLVFQNEEEFFKWYKDKVYKDETVQHIEYVMSKDD